MALVTRRSFLISSAALSVGCTLHRPEGEEQAARAPSIRQPSLGQSWRYAKRDLYTHALLDEQFDRIAAVGSTVNIDSSSEVTPKANAATSSWGTGWLSKYIPHRDTPTGGPLPSEVQEPWGKVLVDPHWSQVQVYETPIPLWPNQLAPGSRSHVNTKYKTPSNEDGLPWEQTTTARNWEMITVPAGNFRALRISNMINFRSVDFSRYVSHRQETVWLAPEVGRWVARECGGTYYIEDSSVDTPYNEPAYRWELLEWT
jgi:hypothetical protein